MLRITVELVPFGDEDRKRQIGEMVIANDGHGDYAAWTAPDGWSGEPARYGVLLNYDRSQSVWELIRLMLEAIRLEQHKVPKAKDSLAQRLKRKLLTLVKSQAS